MSDVRVGKYPLNRQSQRQKILELLQSGKSSEYNFLTAIVQEVVSNPEQWLQRKVVYKEKNIVKGGKPLTKADIYSGRNAIDDDGTAYHINLFNRHFIDYMPINSVIAHIVDGGLSSDGVPPVVAFPFFPPHISFPVKAGEYIWLVHENVKGQDVFYWMCRKVGLRQLDDINYTHLERTDNVVRKIDRYHKDAKPLTNPSSLVNFHKQTSSNLPIGSNFDHLAKYSTSYKEEFTGEPVPRNVKDCGDLLLQGSNNSHIHLCTEKFSKINFPDDSGFSPELFTDKNKNQVIPERRPLSPALDLCIGRKIEDILGLKDEKTKDQSIDGSTLSIVKNTRGESSIKYEHMEIDKIKKVQGQTQNLLEFTDINPTNCLARLYMTNSKNIDKVFGIISTSEEEKSADPVDENGNVSSLVGYSKNTRLIGHSTLKIENRDGQSLIAMTPEGDIVIQSQKGGAKIVLEGESGDIRIVPGTSGIVKIGDDLPGDNGIVPIGAIATEAGPVNPGSRTANSDITTSTGARLTPPLGTGLASTKVMFK